jgi:regulator of sigma E protease
MGGYVKVAGVLDENMDLEIKGEDYEFRSKNTFQKVWFLSAGVLMNFILAIVVFSLMTFSQGIKNPSNTAIVKNVSIDSPASKVGLIANDKILSINDINIDSFEDIKNSVEINFDKEIFLKWERQGIEYSGSLVPLKHDKYKIGEGFISVGIIGISPNYKIEYLSLIDSLFDGIKQTYYWICFLCASLISIVSGDISLDQLSGPIGIVKIAGDTASSGGLFALIYLMALISINLGIINILPFPVVDGGHVMIALIEGLMRREIPLNIKYYIQITGTIFLMLLFFLVFANDIYRLIFQP